MSNESTHIKDITSVLGVMKAALFLFSAALAANTYLIPEQQLLKLTLLILILGFPFGLLVGHIYARYLIELWRFHRMDEWSFIVVLDLLGTAVVLLVVIFSFFGILSERWFILGLLWASISVFGNLLTPLIVSDPFLSKIDEIIGYSGTILYIIIKILEYFRHRDITLLLDMVRSLLGTLGFISAIISFGAKSARRALR